MSKYLSANIKLIKMNGNNDYSIRTITQTIDPSDPLNVINVITSEDNVNSYVGKFKKVDGDVIRSTDIKLYVDPSTVKVTPTIKSKVTDGTTIYNVQDIVTWKEQDTVALYVLQLRE